MWQSATANPKKESHRCGIILSRMNSSTICVARIILITVKPNSISRCQSKVKDTALRQNIDNCISFKSNNLDLCTLYNNIKNIYLPAMMKNLYILLICLTIWTQGATALSERGQAIELQIVDLLEKCRGKTVAMLTNPTSTDGTMRPIFERIIQKSSQYNMNLKCFFAPEHGLRGDQQDGRGDEDYIDKQTGIQVYSLYGTRKAPLPSQLEGVDILIYDIQDVGARYYTFMWTLTYTIQVLAQLNKKLLIFDRPNPLGRKVEGCPLTMDTGLVGRLLPGQQYSIPIRYGLTVGEFIGYLARFLPKVNYEVIKMGKKPYEITDEEWVMSSPNIPTLATVHVYAGMGLIQCTNISEGRGTTKPFQLTGYPGIESKKLVDMVKKAAGENGALFRESYIIPTFNKYTNQICGGLEVMPKALNSDFYEYNSVETALHVLKSYVTLNSTISIKCDRMFGVVGFSDRITRYSPQQILDDCSQYRNSYIKEYKSYWLYQDANQHKNQAQQTDSPKNLVFQE